MGGFHAVLQWTGIGAAVGGGLALLIGFVGPDAISPVVEPGTLAGVLVTGSWGAILGGSLGAVVGYGRSRKAERE